MKKTPAEGYLRKGTGGGEGVMKNLSLCTVSQFAYSEKR